MNWHWGAGTIQVAKTLQAAGGRFFVVGGAVRDQLWRLPAGDVDGEVYGLEASAIVAALQKIGRVTEIGRGFPVWQVLVGGERLEVALPRRDSKIGAGHRDFSIDGQPDLAFAVAVKRRDFTINALLCDPLTGELLDLVGGVADCAERRLRVVDPLTFSDDPLRVWRAIQFVARFNLKIDSQTLSLLQGLAAEPAVAQLSAERVGLEWAKLMGKAGEPALGLTLMRGLGLTPLFPELHALIGTQQEPTWHPEGDVWTHTLMVVNEAARLSPELLIREAALCHDFGKPPVTQVENGQIRSRGHEAVGVPLAGQFLRALNRSRGYIRQVQALTADHLKPSLNLRQLTEGKIDDVQHENLARQIMRRLQAAGVTLDQYLLLTEADIRGRGFPDAATKPYVAGAHFRQVCEEAPWAADPSAPLLSGADLLRYGLEPGPRLGQVQQALEDARDRGEIFSKEQAIALIPHL